MKEAHVAIDGVTLTQGQSMTLRVAMEFFRMDLLKPASLGEDDMGKRLASAYAKNAAEISSMLLEGCKE